MHEFPHTSPLPPSRSSTIYTSTANPDPQTGAVGQQAYSKPVAFANHAQNAYDQPQLQQSGQPYQGALTSYTTSNSLSGYKGHPYAPATGLPAYPAKAAPPQTSNEWYQPQQGSYDWYYQQPTYGSDEWHQQRSTQASTKWYQQQPAYGSRESHQQSYQQQPTYGSQGGYQQSTYGAQGEYQQQPTYSSQGGYQQQPTYSPQSWYQQQPTYGSHEWYKQQQAYGAAAQASYSAEAAPVHGSYGSHQQQSTYGAAAQAGYPTMDYSQYGNSGYSYPPGYSDPYAQQQQYQPAAPQIRNPFAPPPPPRATYAGQNADYDPEHEAALAQWQSTYAPVDEQEKNRRGGKGEKGANPNMAPIGVRPPPLIETGEVKAKPAEDDKKTTVMRKGGGQTWEDQTLLDWDPTQFRIMVGNLAGEVTDDSLAKAFVNYGVSKARVVRDKRTTKSKGFGFVSFLDGEQGFKAAREMVGKYIGSHPVTIQRSKTDIKPVVQKQDRNKGKNNNKNKNKDKGGKQEDPLRAHTGAHIEKKPVKNPAGMKILG